MLQHNQAVSKEGVLDCIPSLVEISHEYMEDLEVLRKKQCWQGPCQFQALNRIKVDHHDAF